ncbi:MAG: class I SAM-dependent methyltransferase [Burkholderiaceae bacterium]|nr:class I SAM-dependent methyltransferase [Burkholderiaceae bacterium]
MKTRREVLRSSVALMLTRAVPLAGFAGTVNAQALDEIARPLDVPYVPTPIAVVDAMLDLAKVGKSDTVYDLGCGDGRIVVRAASRFGCRGVGVDLNPERVKEAKENANRSRVTELTRFEVGDVFDFDFSPASVVTMYLLPSVNLKLRPRLLKELKPGTRLVSHDFHMGDWKAETTREVGRSTIYLWTIPART